MRKIEDLHLKGLGMDTLKANRNFEIFKKIKAVWPELAHIDKYDQNLFVYLKNSSRDYTILYLGRLFDSKSSHNPTRCIDELIYYLENSELEYHQCFLTERKWQDFISKYKSVIDVVYGAEKAELQNFLGKIQGYVNHQKKIMGSPLERLKKWRDKFLAHNEHFEGDVRLEDDEVEFLLSISNSLLEFLNDFVSNEMIVVSPSGTSYFITHLINKTVGNSASSASPDLSS